MKLTRKWLLLAGAGTAAAGVAIGAVLVLGGPSYAHPWCGPVMSEINSKDSVDQFLTAIGRLAPHDPPIVGQLNRDYTMFTGYNGMVQAEMNQVVSAQSISDLNNAAKYSRRATADEAAITAQCGG